MTIGIEIGGTKLQVVAGGQGSIQQRFRYRVDPDLGAAGIRAQIEEALRVIGTRPDAIGVGFGGPVDAATGRIITSHQVSGWAGFGLGEWLREQTGTSAVRVENDANVAALGEARYGAGRGKQHVFYITLGSGVGGGMVTGGQIYRGAAPGEAEVGHLRLDRYGKTLESACSGWAVDKDIRRALAEVPADSILKRLVGAETRGEARFLKEAIEKGDGTARRIVHRVAEDLALGLSHVVHLFHPETIILGGGLSLIGEPLRTGVEKLLPDFVMQAFQPVPTIQLAQLGEDAVPVGALALAEE